VIVKLQGQVDVLSDRLDEERKMRFAMEDSMRAQDLDHEKKIRQMSEDCERKMEQLKSLLNQYADRIKELEHDMNGRQVSDD
jgi:hypothetical protein